MSAAGSLARLVHGWTNARRFGFVFVRARWFKMPRAIRAAGKRVQLHYPADHGAESDFFACIIRNDYGLGRQMRDVRTILDIGANVGFFSMAARGHYPAATIHAYEPNPRVLSFLSANTSALGVEMHPEAVGSRSGFVQILESGSSNQARTGEIARTGAGAGAGIVETGGIAQIALDTAIERMGGTVDLLKLDCEGAEWDLFKLRDAWKRVRNLRMEYHLFRGETVEQVDRTLRGLGFEPIHWERDAGFGMVWARRIG